MVTTAIPRSVAVCPECMSPFAYFTENKGYCACGWAMSFAVPISQYFMECGADVTIYPKAKIVSPGVVSIGDSVIIDDFVLLVGGTRTAIGSFVHIGAGTTVLGGGELVMEDYTGVGSGVRISTGGEDFSGEWMTNPAVPNVYRKPVRSKVVIEKHAIVGAGAIILAGVTIGEGTVIGAGTIVRQDCMPWSVYVGTPARYIRRRPSDRILNELEPRLRAECYNANGKYIPKAIRGGAR